MFIIPLSARQAAPNQARLVFGRHKLQPNKNQKSLMVSPQIRKKGNSMKRKTINFDVLTKDIFWLGKIDSFEFPISKERDGFDSRFNLLTF